MKNTVTHLVLLACAAIAITPGVAGAQEVGFGVKGGFNLSTIAFDPSDVEWGTHFGVVAGGFVALPLNSRLTIQPEGLFSQKGGTAEIDDIEASIRLTYLEVPVLATYAVWTGGGRSFSLFGGPSLGFNLSSETSATVGGEEVDVDIDEDVETLRFRPRRRPGVRDRPLLDRCPLHFRAHQPQRR